MQTESSSLGGRPSRTPDYLLLEDKAFMIYVACSGAAFQLTPIG